MYTITLDQVIASNPCYKTPEGAIDVERLLRLSGGRTEIPAADVFTLDIPDKFESDFGGATWT